MLLQLAAARRGLRVLALGNLASHRWRRCSRQSPGGALEVMLSVLLRPLMVPVLVAG
jgi:hypothetical protein